MCYEQNIWSPCLISRWAHLSMGLSNSYYLRICSVFWSPWPGLCWLWMTLALILILMLSLIMKMMLEANLSFHALLYWTLSLSSEIILSHLQDSKYMLTPWSFVSLILLVMSLLSITLLPSQAFTVTYSPSMTREAALPLLHLWYLIITAWCGVKRQPQVEKYWISSKM